MHTLHPVLHCCCCCSFVVTPEGVTIPVANKGLEKARAYLNQIPRNRQLNVPSKGHEGNPPPQVWVRAEYTLKRKKIPVASGAATSLAGQTFMEKECLVTIDRFLWLGGIQKCNVIAKVMRNTITVSVQPLYNVDDQ